VLRWKQLEPGKVELTLITQTKSAFFGFGAGGRIAKKLFEETVDQLKAGPQAAEATAK
jgi:hypothetical protein